MHYVKSCTISVSTIQYVCLALIWTLPTFSSDMFLLMSDAESCNGESNLCSSTDGQKTLTEC